jgi:hypothetical protein
MIIVAVVGSLGLLGIAIAVAPNRFDAGAVALLCVVAAFGSICRL